jgi:hypothetical protein
MKEIKVVLTMDCEPTTATSHPSATGPADWAMGERAARGYFEIAAEYKFPVTFFIHPETALSQADLFKEFQSRGACLGLHMHPWKYSLWRHQGQRFLAHYGGLSEAEQRALLSEAAALWHEAIGYRPRYFRPGTFSANDAIFRVLAELGFRGGSCTAPGRVIPEMQAIWTGAELDPHRGNRCFRQIAGELDFANMPLSADTSKLLDGPAGRRMYADFRPDTDWLGEYGVSYKTIAVNTVAQVLERSPAVPVLNVITHNHYEYGDRSQAVTQRCRTMLDELCAACEGAGVRPVGATLANIADDVLALPAAMKSFSCEGAIFDKSSERASLDR